MSLSLYTALKAGYGSKEEQINELHKSGYQRDDELSTENEQVYYNPYTHQLLINVDGTDATNKRGMLLQDLGTDAYLAAGHLKDTDRYKSVKKLIEKSKDKYKVTGAILTGHSLGGGLVNLAAGKNDNAVTLDAGFTAGQTARKNVKNYRSSGDWVSTFAPWANTTTLDNPNWKTGNTLYDGYQAHNVDNIKDSHVYVDDNPNNTFDTTKQRRYLPPVDIK